MEISLCKADLKDAANIHEMKVKAFMPLLEKYQDFETSPANETVEKIRKKRINSIELARFLYCQNIKEKELPKKFLQ